MKIRNIAIGVVVGGVIFAGGVAAVAWQKGLSIRETVELGAGVIASKTSRHTIADRTTSTSPICMSVPKATQEDR